MMSQNVNRHELIDDCIYVRGVSDVAAEAKARAIRPVFNLKPLQRAALQPLYPNA